MEDTKIIDLYFARTEQALAETERKYGRYCFSLADSILHNSGDSEEVVNDTYLKVREHNIFLRRYFFVEETAVIAARYGMRPDSVRRSLSRTRTKLKNYLMQGGFTV